MDPRVDVPLAEQCTPRGAVVFTYHISEPGPVMTLRWICMSSIAALATKRVEQCRFRQTTATDTGQPTAGMNSSYLQPSSNSICQYHYLLDEYSTTSKH